MSANFFALAGQRAWRRGDYLNAIEAYRTATRLQPDHETFKLDLAQMLIQTGESDGAAELIHIASDEFWESARTWYLLAEVYKGNHRFEESLRAVDKSIEFHEDFAARTIRAALLMRLGRFDQATFEYGSLAEQHSGHEREFYFRYWIGMATYRGEKSEVALGGNSSGHRWCAELGRINGRSCAIGELLRRQTKRCRIGSAASRE